MHATDASKNQASGSLQVTATLEGLVLSRVSVSSQDIGFVLRGLFQNHPDLPGVIITLPDGAVSGLSKQEYFRQMARPFGPEVYNRRPIKLLLDHGVPTLSWMPGSTQVEAAAEEILRRSESRRYEPLLTNDRNGCPGIVDVHSILIALSQLSSIRARQMALILDTVPEGFLVIGSDRKILPGYSLSAAAMLGLFDLAGMTFDEALSNLDSKLADRVRSFVEILFNPALLDRLLEPANPVREFQARSAHGEPLHLAIRFKRVREQGCISQILVMIEDLTLRKRLENEATKLRDTAQMRFEVLTQLAGADPHHLPGFLDNFNALCQRLEKLEPGEDLNALRRRCHALKGEAGALGLSSFRTALHKAEDVIELDAPHRASMIGVLAELRAAAADLLTLARKLLSESSDPATASSSPSAVLSRFQALKKMLSLAVSEACNLTGKQARFELRGCFDMMSSRELGLLREVLQQLVRNAVVHGIETPAQRVAAGKPPEGTIIVAAREAGEFFEIITQDDGAGLDREALRNRAGESGEEISAEELIFIDGISTAQTLSELAGRGVGLGQIRESILIHGGTIAVHTQPGSYTAFQIVLPRTNQMHETADR